MPATRSSARLAAAAPRTCSQVAHRAPSVEVVPSSETEDDYDDGDSIDSHDSEEPIRLLGHHVRTTVPRWLSRNEKRSMGFESGSEPGPLRRITRSVVPSEAPNAQDEDVSEAQPPACPPSPQSVPVPSPTKRKRTDSADASVSEPTDDLPLSKRKFERTESILSTTSTLVDGQSDGAELMAHDPKTLDEPSKPTSIDRPTTYPHIYAHARALLRGTSHADGAAAHQLVGRTEERKAIMSFLHDRLSLGLIPSANTAQGAMYIAGTPGTGKTALVCDVVSCLDEEVDVALLNCVSLASASDVYGTILRSLSPDCLTEPATPKRGRPRRDNSEKLLMARLATPKRNTVIVLDEMDSLLRSGTHQDVLYNIFLAVSHAVSGPKTALLGIANSLDLAEHFLPLLAGHKAYPKLLSFSPFRVEEIVDVVSSRLRGLYPRYDGIVDDAATEATTEEIPVFTKSGLRLAAMKVAAITGDLRKALDVCRLAIESLEQQQKTKGVDLSTLTPSIAPRVGPPQVLSAVQRALPTGTSAGTGAPSGASATNVARVRALPLHAGLLLASYLLVDFGFKHLGSGKLDVSAVYDKYTRILQDDGSFSPLPLGEVLDILANLETQAFIDLSAPKTGVTPAQAKGASRAAMKALAKRGATSGAAPALGARSREITLRLPVDDVRRALTEASSAAAGTGKTVATETIARLMQAEQKRILRAKGWEQVAAGFEEARKNELGGGRTAVAQGL